MIVKDHNHDAIIESNSSKDKIEMEPNVTNDEIAASTTVALTLKKSDKKNIHINHGHSHSKKSGGPSSKNKSSKNRCQILCMFT